MRVNIHFRAIVLPYAGVLIAVCIGIVWLLVDLTLYIQTLFLSYGYDNFLRIYSRGERYPSALCG